MFSTRFHACWRLLIISLLLGACGGGGGGGGTAATPPPAPPTSGAPDTETPRFATVVGTAAKGILVNASVSAYLIEGDGSRGALLGTTQTGNDGTYQLDILAQSAPVWLELTPSSTAYMVCDSSSGCGEASNSDYDVNTNGTVDFGEKMALPPGFQLRALIPSAESGRIQAAITPLTHMAAVLAEAFPQGVDGLSVAMANSQMANLFQLDGSILALSVPDVTKRNHFQAADARQRKYALVLGAFAGLAQNGDFVALLQEAVEIVRSMQGQIPNRSSEAHRLSLSAWADKALELATQLNDEALITAFTSLKQMADVAENDATSATPDSNISSNEIRATKKLITNVRDLRGTLNVMSLDAPLPGFSPLMDATEDLSSNTSAMTHGSRLAAFVAVPKVALEAACNSISNYFTAYLCRSIVANKTLDEICALTFSNLSIGGKTLCEYLNALRLPAGNGLVAELALMDGVALVEGERDDTRIEMELSRGVTSDDTMVTMDWRAALVGPEFSLRVPEGTIAYRFDDITRLSSINNPNSIDSAFTANLNLTSDQVSRFRGDATTNIDFSNEDNPISSTRLDGTYTDSVGQTMDMNLSMTQQETVGSLMAAQLVHPLDGRRITVSLARSESGDSIRMQWPGHTINAVTRLDRNTVSINNGGAVKIKLNLAAQEGEPVGHVTYNGKPYGNVAWQADALVVQLPNGETAPLY